VSFIIGNIFLFGAIICNFIPSWNEYVFHFAQIGFYYLPVASIINILIIMLLSFYYFEVKETIKNYFKAVGYILLNIPIAIIYAYIGLSLLIT
jgi:LIVCS family branched-chain amino acid:cation transporter